MPRGQASSPSRSLLPAPPTSHSAPTGPLPWAEQRAHLALSPALLQLGPQVQRAARHAGQLPGQRVVGPPQVLQLLPQKGVHLGEAGTPVWQKPWWRGRGYEGPSETKAPSPQGPARPCSGVQPPALPLSGTDHLYWVLRAPSNRGQCLGATLAAFSFPETPVVSLLPAELSWLWPPTVAPRHRGDPRRQGVRAGGEVLSRSGAGGDGLQTRQVGVHPLEPAPSLGLLPAPSPQIGVQEASQHTPHPSP